MNCGTFSPNPRTRGKSHRTSRHANKTGQFCLRFPSQVPPPSLARQHYERKIIIVREIKTRGRRLSVMPRVVPLYLFTAPAKRRGAELSSD